jgi:hypothetical protein
LSLISPPTVFCLIFTRTPMYNTLHRKHQLH